MKLQVVYFAATFPYVILLTLLVTGLLQPGAIDGVLFFLLPTWGKLLDIQVHTHTHFMKAHVAILARRDIFRPLGFPSAELFFSAKY